MVKALGVPVVMAKEEVNVVLDPATLRENVDHARESAEYAMRGSARRNLPRLFVLMLLLQGMRMKKVGRRSPAGVTEQLVAAAVLLLGLARVIVLREDVDVVVLEVAVAVEGLVVVVIVAHLVALVWLNLQKMLHATKGRITKRLESRLPNHSRPLLRLLQLPRLLKQNKGGGWGAE